MEIGYYKKFGEPWSSGKDRKKIEPLRAILKRETKKITEEMLKEMWENSNFIAKGDDTCEPRTIDGHVVWVKRHE